MNIKTTMVSLKAYAIANGFNKVVFRDHKTNQGDFCIFLYNEKINPNRYCVGFDGSWDCENYPELSFNACVNSAIRYIDNYTKNN